MSHTIKLSKATTVDLIQSYRKKEALWNVQSVLYKRLDLKQKGWEELSAEFNISIEMLKKKIKYLRTSYMSEKKKAEALKNSGGNGIYVPNLFYYQEMEFLNSSSTITDVNAPSNSSCDFLKREDFCETDTSESTVQENKIRQRNSRGIERQARYYNKRSDTIKLSKETTIALIQSYRKKETLWNIQSVLYKRLDLKRKGWEELSAEFNISIEMLKKKIKYLRTSYMYENKKAEASKNSGRNEIYVPNLFYYQEMEFLNRSSTITDVIENAPSNSSCASVEEEDFCETDTSEPTVQENEKRQRDNAATEREERYNNAMAALVGSVNKKIRKEDDVFSAFGKSIAIQLRQMPFFYASEAMSDIQTIVSRKTQKFFSDEARRSSSNNNSTASINSDIYEQYGAVPISADISFE